MWGHPMPNEMVTLSIDNRQVQAKENTTIWQAARSVGIEIPTLCHDEKLEPVAVCRVCVVEVENNRTLPAACIRKVEKGMSVRTNSSRVRRARRTLVELLESGQPGIKNRSKALENDELFNLGNQLEIKQNRFTSLSKSTQIKKDLSSPVISVDHNACILCDRCIRACNDIQVNDVIGRAGKGCNTKIVFDNDLPMGSSSCVSCGECVAACPTSALTDALLEANPDTLRKSKSGGKKKNRPVVLERPGENLSKEIDSVCPYCGVGCGISYHVNNNQIIKVTGRDNSHTQGRLCVKGRYGYDYTSHLQRLKKPLIRKERSYPKSPLSADFKTYQEFRASLRSSEWTERIYDVYREAEWDEVLEMSARRFMEIKKEYGSAALAGFGSAKVTNEEAYLFQKLIRVVFGTNNVDHCTRLCHASSVVALTEGIGSGAVSNTFQECLDTDVIFLIGSNTEDNHPVAASFMKQAVNQGVKLIVLDPRRPTIADHSTHYVRFKPGTDVALLNGLMHVIIRDNLQNKKFIADRTEGFEDLASNLVQYTPDFTSKITGVSASVIVNVARAYGCAQRAMIFWGMGISQHVNGTDNARALISLCLMTGNIGRNGTGLHPLRGQNNVQGASDVGLIPKYYPGYQEVEDPKVRKHFENAWGAKLDPKSGLTVVEIMQAALSGQIKGMFMMGENPFLSDPNTNKVRKALQNLSFLVVQDIFLTETAEFADVVLPGSTSAEKTGSYINTNRMVQLGQQAVRPPGEARLDGEILIDLANQMIDLQNDGENQPWFYNNPEEIWEEIVANTPILKGITYDSLQKDAYIWPEGEKVLFKEKFPLGRGKFKAVKFAQPHELPDEIYPFVLNTGRILQHWHTGTMTRRSEALDKIAPEPFVEMTKRDLSHLNIREGDQVVVSSRRGEITLKTKMSTSVTNGSVFIPFHFKEAAVNLLTSDLIDPDGKIPEFKYTAVAIKKVI